MSKARNVKKILGLESTKITNLEGYSGLVYARVSSKRQEIEGTGLTSQEERCKGELSSLKVSYEKTFFDSYTGGGNFMDRPAMRELLGYIDSKPHKKFVVVFDDLKRFARDVEFHLKLRAAFEMRGIVLKCLNFTFDETPEGRYSEIIMAGHAELERHQNRRQVVQKQRARLEAGYWAFGRKRGYEKVRHPDHGKLDVPNKEGLEILALALEGFANGTFQRVIDVCRFLVDRGFWTKQKPEKYIDKTKKMLLDPFYAGFIEYLEWEVELRPGKHQGLISWEIHELIVKRLSKTDLNKRVRMDISPDFELRGLIVCADCRGHLTGTWYPNGKGQRYRRYICQQNPNCPSFKKVIKAEEVEERFEVVLKKGQLKVGVDTVLKRMFNGVWDNEMEKLNHSQAGVDKQKRALEQKLSELTDLMLNARTETMKRAYERQIESVAKELDDLEGQSLSNLDLSVPYQTSLEKATLVLKKPDIAWENLDPFEKQRLYFFLFQEKLPYSKKYGYQTSEIPYSSKLFEDFVTQNTPLVEMAGVKPASKT